MDRFEVRQGWSNETGFDINNFAAYIGRVALPSRVEIDMWTVLWYRI